MPAGTLAELENGFAKAAQVLGLRDKDHLDIKERIRAARAWFAENTNYLLVLDDVTDFSVFEKDMLRFGMRGKLLITTRFQDQAVIGVPQPFELWSLSADDAAGLLLHRSERSDDSANRADATKLVEALGCLPLAIEQASAFLHWHPNCSIAAFLSDFQKRKLSVFEIGSDEDVRENVRTTWDISIAKIGKKHPFAKGLMTLSSFLAPDDIPKEFARYYFPVQGTAEKALDVLQRYSLIHRGELQELYSIHRLLQECVLMPFKDYTKKGYLQTAVDNLLNVFTAFEQDIEKDCEILLPHVSVCADHIQNYSIHSRTAWKLLYKASAYLSEQARYAAAEPLLGQLIGGVRQEEDPKDVEKIKQYQAAAQSTKTLADILTESDPLAMARELNNLASSYLDQGRYSAAVPLSIRSLEITEHILGKDHYYVAISLNTLAEIYRGQGHYLDAEPLFIRSLHIRERVLGKDHFDVATILNNLGLMYNIQGRYSEAEPLLTRALDICKRIPGQDDLNVTKAMGNLAVLYYSQGRYSEAETLLIDALNNYERLFGKDHHNVALVLNNLAELYGIQGRYSEAEPLSIRSLNIQEHVLGKDHPSVATVLNNLAGVYKELGRNSEAELLYIRSLKIWERALGRDHSDIANSLNNLAALYDSQGRYSEAETLYMRSIDIRERVLGKDHPDVATTLNNLAELYKAVGRDSEAESIYRRSLSIAEKSMGAEHPSTITIRANLESLKNKSQ